MMPWFRAIFAEGRFEYGDFMQSFELMVHHRFIRTSQYPDRLPVGPANELPVVI